MRVPRFDLTELNDGADVSRVFIAASRAEAEEVRGLLESLVTRYAIELEPFRPAGLAREHVGVAFYVRPTDAERIRRLLAGAGLKAGVADDGRSTG